VGSSDTLKAALAAEKRKKKAAALAAWKKKKKIDVRPNAFKAVLSVLEQRKRCHY